MYLSSICLDIKRSNFSYRIFKHLIGIFNGAKSILSLLKLLYLISICFVSHFCVSWFKQTANVIERIIQVYGVMKPLHRVSRCKNKASTSRLLRMRHKVAEFFGFSIFFFLFFFRFSVRIKFYAFTFKSVSFFFSVLSKKSERKKVWDTYWSFLLRYTKSFIKLNKGSSPGK